jgi:hypothetical protein
MEEAVEHAMTWTPRGWLPDGNLVRFEQHLYLRQPGYGTSYLSGKIQIEELLAEEALQRGDDFTVKVFFDDFFDAGVIPIVLTRWEMTGTRDDILTNTCAPGLRYVSTDPGECTRLRFRCADDEEPFSNRCGCGCQGL